jgi:hypothetical protein
MQTKIGLGMQIELLIAWKNCVLGMVVSAVPLS